jgi:ribosome biogenesis GTPase
MEIRVSSDIAALSLDINEGRINDGFFFERIAFEGLAQSVRHRNNMEISMQAMELTDLGFDDWFREQQEETQNLELSIARVTAVDRGRYLVRGEYGEVPAEATGKLLYAAESSVDLPCVGDWVYVQYHNENTLAIIHARFPRKSILQRKSAGRKTEYQVIASNIDTAFIVQSCEFDFNLRRLERYVAMAIEGQIKPVFLLSKTDLLNQQDLETRLAEIKQSGIVEDVLPLSNLNERGLDQVREVLEPGKTYCLIGSSGVGKTTLLNHLIGRPEFETKEIRLKDGKGRHATSRRQLVVLDEGAMVIDTPGMRELGLIEIGTGMEESFSDILALAKLCHFRNCTHTSETGCSVQQAIESGDLSEERYRSYLKLVKEAEYHQRTYFEQRQKDREFGRHVRSIMKDRKKNRGQ